jgi:hypothetical protein
VGEGVKDVEGGLCEPEPGRCGHNG